MTNYWAQISTPEGRVILTPELDELGEITWRGVRVSDGQEVAVESFASYRCASDSLTPAALIALAASYGSDVWELEVWSGREQLWP